MLEQGGRVTGREPWVAYLLRSGPSGGYKTQSTRTQSTAAAAALNLRSSRKSDRLLVAGCCSVGGSVHNRGCCGAPEVEAVGGDSDVDTAELRGTGTDTEHRGAESS